MDMASQDDLSMVQPAGRGRQSLADFEDRGWQTGVFRAVAIAVLAASIVVAPLAVVREVMLWELNYIVPLAFLAALEGVISTRRLGRPAWRNRRGMAYRLGEMVLFVLAARLAVWAFALGWPGMSALGTLLRHPGAFFDGQTVATTGMLLVAWLLATDITADFLDLAIQPDEVAARESRTLGASRSDFLASRPVGRGEIVARFAARWAWGGVPLVVFAGLSRLDFKQDASSLVRVSLSGMGLPRDVMIGLLCYFLVGLLLLSDARLAMLRGRWYNEQVTIAPPLLRRWHWLGLSVVVALGALGLLLPLGPVGPLGDAIAWLLMQAMRIAVFLILLFMYVLTRLLAPLQRLFRNGEEPPTAVEPPALPSQAELAPLLQAPDWLRGAFVWTVVGLVAGYLLLNYLRSYGWLDGPWLEKLTALRFWWRSRRSRLGAGVQAQIAALRARLQRPRPARPERLQRASFRPGSLPPRAKVRYYYLRATQRAAEQGRARPPHATPLEYVQELETTWPEAETDVQDLTEAFLAARYAAREIAADEARGVQLVWRRVMRVLRQPATADRA